MSLLNAPYKPLVAINNYVMPIHINGFTVSSGGIKGAAIAVRCKRLLRELRRNAK